MQDGLPSPYITDLAQDAAGRIWAGTWLGIASLDPDADEWTQPIVADELPSAHVTALLAQQRQLWIGTDSGLIHYDIATGALLDVAVLDGQAVQDLALDSPAICVGAAGTHAVAAMPTPATPAQRKNSRRVVNPLI